MRKVTRAETIISGEHSNERYDPLTTTTPTSSDSSLSSLDSSEVVSSVVSVSFSNQSATNPESRSSPPQVAKGSRNPPYSNRKPPTNGPMVVPAPNIVSMMARTVDWDLVSHLMARGYTAVDMADSPTAVMDLMIRDSAKNNEPDLIIGKNPNMMLVIPEMMQPAMNNLQGRLYSFKNNDFILYIVHIIFII